MKTKAKAPVTFSLQYSADETWKPKRRGEIYCSPACGGCCTKSDYDRAVTSVIQLVKTLGPAAWKGVVWENLGWHFKAVAGPLEVRGDYWGKNKSLRFSCSMHGRVPGDFVSSDAKKAVVYTVTHCINGACRAFGSLFEACQAADMTPEFFREFSQLPAIEFLRFPGGRTIEGAAKAALGKDPQYDRQASKSNPKPRAKR